MEQYAVDRRSIYVGNLPTGTTESQVREIFQDYGEIARVLLRESTSKYERKLFGLLRSGYANIL